MFSPSSSNRNSTLAVSSSSNNLRSQELAALSERKRSYKAQVQRLLQDQQHANKQKRLLLFQVNKKATALKAAQATVASQKEELERATQTIESQALELRALRADVRYLGELCLKHDLDDDLELMKQCSNSKTTSASNNRESIETVKASNTSMIASESDDDDDDDDDVEIVGSEQFSSAMIASQTTQDQEKYRKELQEMVDDIVGAFPLWLLKKAQLDEAKRNKKAPQVATSCTPTTTPSTTATTSIMASDMEVEVVVNDIAALQVKDQAGARRRLQTSWLLPLKKRSRFQRQQAQLKNKQHQAASLPLLLSRDSVTSAVDIPTESISLDSSSEVA